MKTFSKIFCSVLFLVLVALSVKESGRPKIYDCFLFFNETELLKLRLSELYDHVDKFVIVESTETHRGNAKSLNFEKNKRLFKKFADKIIYVPLHEKLTTNDFWVRENYQRNQIVRGLTGCNDHDIILISDLDEIVNPDRLKEIRHHLMRGKRTYVSTTQRMYKYYLNHFESLWHGTVATTYSALTTLSPQYFRNHRNKGLSIEDAGWHFTYMGGLDKVTEKCAAIVEGVTFSRDNTSSYFQEMHSGMLDDQFEKIDDSFPKYIQENQSHLKKIGFLR